MGPSALSGREVLLDHSAWARLGERHLDVAKALERGHLWVCLPFLLEAGYSARTRDYEDHLATLLTLPRVPIDMAIEQRAIDAQRQLASVSQHRLPPVDLIVAAAADVNDLGVLHYDSDYDLILERTDLEFESVWLAP